MTHIYSHTFKFETLDSTNNQKVNNNIISVIEEDSKKHYINYLHFFINGDDTISTREMNIKVDRSYYLEIANVSIDDIERKKRLFTIVGKRCFGQNNNKLDCYFYEDGIDSEKVYECFEKHRNDKYTHPILHELVTHTTNTNEAYPFYCENRYFSILKQTNISNRKKFEKSFIVQMNKSDYTKLLTYQTNELKIDYIFNLIGQIYFKKQPLISKSYNEIDYSPESIIEKKLDEISDGNITNKTFLNKELFDSLKSNRSNIETAYFNFLSRGYKFIHEPDCEETIFLFADSICDAVKLVEDEELFDEIISFLELLNIIIKEKKISYLISKKDQDIQDIFIFMLETITAWNNTLNDQSLESFNRASIDLYNILRYFVDRYFKFYYDYKSIDALSCQDQEYVKKEKEKAKEIEENICVKDEKIVSAKEFFKDLEIDYAILDEIMELQSELESSLYTNPINKSLKDSSQRFLSRFAYLLNNFYELQNIAYILSILSEQMENFDLFKQNDAMINLYRGIIDDLILWKEEVFIQQSSKNIHNIDDLLYINVARIDMFLEGDTDI